MKFRLLLALMLLTLVVEGCSLVPKFKNIDWSMGLSNKQEKLNNPCDGGAFCPDNKPYDIAWDYWQPKECGFFKMNCATARSEFPVSYRTEASAEAFDINRSGATVPASRNTVKGN